MECPVPEPRKEHAWLQRMVGEWTYESEMIMGPGKPSVKAGGSGVVRSIGGLWILEEGRGEMPGGGEATMILTLGYDPSKERFVGTWIGSMMTNMFVYDGGLDPEGRVLTLETEGPSFFTPGETARYRDVIEIENDDHRVLRSSALGPDGDWHEFMTARYRRTT